VTIGDDSQIIPFAVAHPDDPTVVSYAFVWVPGYNDALPQLRKGLPGLSVPSESTLTIDINKYVVAVGNTKVRLTDESTVRATHSDGTPLARDSGTLLFTSADKYYGPASISFEVTDGVSATDPDGRTATIVLPIDVTPRQNQPPTFDGAVIDFEPDQTKIIDLLKLTTYPYPNDQRELTYTVLEPKPVGFTWSQNGTQLTIRANESAAKGSVSSFTIGVRDGINQGRAGRIELRVVASTRPLALPAADSQIAPRGHTTIVDVLANDNATNPFPAVPLRVIAVRGLDSGSLPAGIAITPSPDKSRLSVRVAADAAPVDTNLQYQVADATGDSDRYAWGTVRISVQDKPDPVSNVRVTGFTDRKLSVTFNPGAANNSPILGYELTLLNASTGAPLGTLPCPDTTCDLVTPGNGRANAVRVSVVARNSIGASTPVVTTGPVWSDVVPAAPTLLPAAPLDGGLRLSWKTVLPQGGATAVRGYVVTAGGQTQGEVSATGPSCSATTCTVDVPGGNGTDVTYSVSARNDAYPALSSWNSAQGSGKPFGPARAGGISANSTEASGSVTVTWDPFDGQGNPIRGYYVQRLTDPTPPDSQECTVSAPAPGDVSPPSSAGGNVAERRDAPADATSVKFDKLDTSRGEFYFVVWGYNQAGCAKTAVATAIVSPAPGPVELVEPAMEWHGDAWDYHVRGVRQAGGADYYQIREAEGATPQRFSGEGWPLQILNLRYGEVVKFDVQACTTWGGCGPWTTYSGTEESLTFTVGGLKYDAMTGIFSWTNGPKNGSLAATYTCFANADPQKTGTATDPQTVCAIGGTLPAGQAQLIVTVRGHDYSYTRQ
jgi:large repetitive protein